VILTLAISGYRSLRDVVIDLDRLTVVTGANGSGKSSFYRALRLMSEIAQDGVIRALAAEGGLSSTLWAGPESFSRAVKSGEQPVHGTRRSTTVALKLGFASEDYGYAMDLGLPQPSSSMFGGDPEIKLESLWIGERLKRNNVLAERMGPSVRIRDREGAWAQVHTSLAPYDSMMTQCAGTRDGLDLLAVREFMRKWRFYDHFRTDPDAPARRPQIGTRTTALHSDGRDVAAALQTIIEIGDDAGLYAAIEDAFPGSSVQIVPSDAHFHLEMVQHGLLRPLSAAELSDGTLRYLLLVAALLSPRPPNLMILNEPETSLHGDLIAPLARLITAASQRSQTIVVTHSQALIAGLGRGKDVGHVVLRKELGQTLAEAEREPASWTWPKR
jgi:predicted ATPase